MAGTQSPRHLSPKIHPKRFGIAVLPTIIAFWLPKCPLCWMGLMGALGLGSVINRAWLQPLTMALLALSLAVLTFRAPTRHGYGPFGLGLLAATIIYVSKFSLDSDWLIYSGGGLLFVASAWNAWPKKREKAEAHCACQASTDYS
jgi:mercuric ion transport protein